MSDISMLLYEARISKGQSLATVADKLKIREKYLRAIEEDIELVDGPAPVYMLGYLRIYADYLGLNGQDMVQRLKASAVEMVDLHFPEPDANDHRPTRTIIFSSMSLFVIFYFSLLNLTHSKDIFDPYTGVAEQIVKSNVTGRLTSSGAINSGLANKVEPSSAQDKELILVAKSDSLVTITDSKGHIFQKFETKVGDIHALSLNHDQIITSSKNDAVEVLTK